MALSPMMESMAHECVLLIKSDTPDGEGGAVAAWTDGAAFKTYPAPDRSMKARIAEKDGLTSVYTILVPQDAPVSFGDYYRDNTSDEIFHITSDPGEKYTPAISALNLKMFTAEKAALPGF